MDNLNRIDFSKRRNESRASLSGVVLYDMIERILFHSPTFSQKRKGKRETHGRCGSFWSFSPSAGIKYLFATGSIVLETVVPNTRWIVSPK
jgi:hypothetical protein